MTFTGVVHRRSFPTGAAKHTKGDFIDGRAWERKPYEGECKYNMVFISKRRRTELYGEYRRRLGEVFHKLAEQNECRIEEGPSSPKGRAASAAPSSRFERLTS